MELEYGLRATYVLVATVVLMMWMSVSAARDIDSVHYSPCYFNPLCSCSKAVPDLGIVRCQDIVLPRIPDTVNSSKVFKLHMENNDLRHIEPYFLQNTGLYGIAITHNPLSYISDEAFTGLERSLWELDLSHNELTEVPSRAFKYLQKLRHVDLRGNYISEIKPDSWRGLEDSLEVLILAENSISRLPLDAFSGLPVLDTIDLAGNNLHEIDPSVFRDGMGRLAHLILKDNQLSAIPYEALSPLKMLKTLDLSYNKIRRMQPEYSDNVRQQFSYKFSLDILRLDYNQIVELEPESFQYFSVLNKTYLDGNPLKYVEENAFRPSKIRELYMRGCEMSQISPLAFGGLEGSLHILDLSGNNLTLLHTDMFHRFEVLRTVSFRDNMITDFNPVETFNGFQYTVHKLDLSGVKNAPVAIQDLRRLRNLRSLSLSRLSDRQLQPEDFSEFGIDLEELQINYGELKAIKNHAFQYVHGLKKIDFSENKIELMESDAFVDIGHSLISLKMSHAFSSSVEQIPMEPLRSLTNLEELDLSYNRLKSMPDNSFHFLKKLKILQLQDNLIERVQKGTFQGDLHSELEMIYLSFNNLKGIHQHTFTDLAFLEQLHLDDNKIVNLERRAFMNLNKLKRLNLKGNKISTISYEAFQNLPELEDLDMSFNSIEKFEFSIFDQVGTLSMFKVNVSHNQIDRLSSQDAMAYLREGPGGSHSNIKILDLSYNNISYIGARYFKPMELSLTHLYISHNNLRNSTKDVFGNMPYLQLLDLSYNDIFELDYDSFKSTQNLQEIFFGNNEISEIPRDLFRNLKKIRVVDFSNNRLRILPDNLFKEEGLEKLDLSANDFNRFPFNSFSLSASSTLCELDMSRNAISSLAHGEAMSKFKNLLLLDLSYNRLVQLEMAPFAYLPNLLDLDLSHNSQLMLERSGHSFKGLEDSLLHLRLANVSLTQVPELPLPTLLTLSLAHNSLPTIPPEIATNLSSLRRLDLAYNDLTTVPIVTLSLKKVTDLSLAGNPITILSNTSLLGIAERLEELDIRDMELNTFETGAFCKMYSLRTLKVSDYNNIKDFNIPSIIEKNTGLRNLEIHVKKVTDLEREMRGLLPSKLRNITFTGRGLTKVSPYILQGVRSPFLYLSFHNTSLSEIPVELFYNLGWAKNITIDVRGNENLRKLENPSTGNKPALPGQTFLTDVWMSGNKWNCDCNLGWVEFWQRKRRQYLCGDRPSSKSPYNSFGYSCRHAEDDLRSSVCINKNNQSLIEVLKADIECGWSSVSSVQGAIVTIIITFIPLYFSFF